MKKRILSLILCLCVAISILTVPALAAGFSDVKDGDYFAEPVAWAVQQGITNGTSATTFSPNQTCTRAEILTFLWRAAGSPEPKTYTSFSPYFDVEMTDYFFKPAAWATEYGIVDIEGVYFNPKTPCTRADTVEYFWRYARSGKTDTIPFSDVTANTDLARAVSWAVIKGITNGTSSTTFSPKATCTRGQIVTFLHRYFVAPLDNSEFVSGAVIPTAPVDPMKLDPLPPEDYHKHAEWYMSLTPVGEMSNARLVAESDSIAAVIADYKARDAFITDSIYIRRDDIMYQIMERSQIVESYDEYVKYNADYGWEIPDYILEDYQNLVDKYGDPQILRDLGN